MSKKNRTMTHRQKSFVTYYLRNGIATESAKLAGYSERTAYSTGQRLLKNVEVAKKIREHQNKALDIAETTVSEVVQMVKEMAINGKTENNRLRAMDMLLRHLGAYTDELKIISSLNDNEIDKLVNRLLAKIN